MAGWRLRVAAGVMALLAVATARADGLELAWLRAGKVTAVALTGSAPARASTLAEARVTEPRVPLGSLWKLFVYAYLVAREVPSPPYVCAAKPATEDVYCCDPGGQVERDAALAQSCGQFFEPRRLGISASAWRGFWSARVEGDARWLADLEHLRPDYHVSVAAVLAALAAVPEGARERAQEPLLAMLLNGRGQGTVRYFGGGVRIKTFTWRHPERPGQRLGGAAGWLVDGTPVWFAATGASKQVLQRWAGEVARNLPAPAARQDAAHCVTVDYFARYPLADVALVDDEAAPPSGPLMGRVRVRFTNGQRLELRSQGELSLVRGTEGGMRIVGRLGLDEYIARVIDREGDARATEAAKALAVAARSYLLQNALREAGCYRIADSSRTQRVSPNPASVAARRVAQWTDGLTLNTPTVNYHRVRSGEHLLGWTDAVARAQRGEYFDQILASAFGDAGLRTVGGQSECRRLAAAEDWLRRAARGWHGRLIAEPGYEPVFGAFQVCQLEQGHPWSDQARQRIFVRGMGSVNDRLALAHEYLHLAFRHHPRGGDEGFVEVMARKLVNEVPGNG